MQYNIYNATQLIDNLTTCNLVSIFDEDIYFKNSKTQKPEKSKSSLETRLRLIPVIPILRASEVIRLSSTTSKGILEASVSTNFILTITYAA